MTTIHPAAAYARLASTINGLDGTRLHPGECAILRAAADARLFADDDAEQRLYAAEELIERLVTNERMQPELAELLLEQLEAVDDHRGGVLAGAS
jgi:hypothetical protein